MTTDKETRARLVKLINRMADTMDDMRSLAIEILSEKAEVINLLPDFQGLEEIPIEGEPIPVQNLPQYVPSAARRYSDMLKPRRQSHWAAEGKIATYELAKAMDAEFPGMDTRKISLICERLGITVYTHAHSKYIMYNLADLVADEARRMKRG